MNDFFLQKPPATLPESESPKSKSRRRKKKDPNPEPRLNESVPQTNGQRLSLNGHQTIDSILPETEIDDHLIGEDQDDCNDQNGVFGDVYDDIGDIDDDIGDVDDDCGDFYIDDVEIKDEFDEAESLSPDFIINRYKVKSSKL